MMLCKNVREAKTYQEKKRGLIGSDGKTGLFMKTRWGVHTFGMTFPIDVVILDKKNKVIKYKRGMKPNRIMLWSPIYNKVVEIPTALIPEEVIQIGDELDIRN